MLYGRSEQLAAIGRLLEGMRSGRAGVLVLRVGAVGGRPVLVLVDDAQWVDRASADALVFAARRLQAERAAVLVAARDEPPSADLPGLPELRVGGLDREAAGRLLAGAGLVRAVRDQLIAEAGGNPLALIELSRGLSGPQRAGS